MVHGLETMKRLNTEAMLKAMARSPLSELQAALLANDDYAWTWQCNLACIGLDSGGDHETSNRYAAQFLKNAFGVDVRTQENWKGFEAQWAEQGNNGPSTVALEIAARVWCDQEMGSCVMDADAAAAIAKIIDRVKNANR